jgi:hypothetical protein
MSALSSNNINMKMEATGGDGMGAMNDFRGGSNGMNLTTIPSPFPTGKASVPSDLSGKRSDPSMTSSISSHQQFMSMPAQVQLNPNMGMQAQPQNMQQVGSTNIGIPQPQSSMSQMNGNIGMPPGAGSAQVDNLIPSPPGKSPAGFNQTMQQPSNVNQISGQVGVPPFSGQQQDSQSQFQGNTMQHQHTGSNQMMMPQQLQQMAPQQMIPMPQQQMGSQMIMPQQQLMTPQGQMTGQMIMPQQQQMMPQPGHMANFQGNNGTGMGNQQQQQGGNPFDTY